MLLLCLWSWGVGVAGFVPSAQSGREAPPPPPPPLQGQASAPSCFCSHNWEGLRGIWVEFPAPPLLSTRGQSWPGCADRNCDFCLLDVAGVSCLLQDRVIENIKWF